MKKKVLILGGTGAMGKDLVDILSKDDIQIYATTRKDRESQNNVNYIKGNAHDFSFLENLILNNDFDSIVDFMVYSPDEFKEKIELFLNNTKQYVFISSARVYSNLDKNINEKTKRLLDVCNDENFLKRKDYAIEKAEEENLLIQNSKKNWTIIRPYITYNDNRLQLGVYEKEQWLYRVLKGKPIAIQKKLLNKKTTLTFGYDVSKYMSKLVLNEKAYGEIFQIVNNLSDVTWKDIVDVYKNELKLNNINMNIKEIENEKYDEYLNYYQLNYDRYYDRVFNSNKLENTINEKTSYVDVKEGLSKCLSSFLNNVNINDIKLDPYFNGVMDKITKTSTNIREFNSFKEKIIYILAKYTSYFKYKNDVKKVSKKSTSGGGA